MSEELVRIVDRKIAELNTGGRECNVPLPAELHGTHLDSWRYVDGAFVPDSEWVEPVGPPPAFPWQGGEG